MRLPHSAVIVQESSKCGQGTMHRGVRFPSESAEDIELIFLLLLKRDVLCDNSDERLRLAVLAGVRFIGLKERYSWDRHGLDES